MDTILIQLQQIVVRALPALIITLLLYFYLKKVLFRPLDNILAERAKRTMGAAAEAERRLGEVLKKEGDYQQALLAARSEMYQELEDHRKGLAAEQGKAVDASRANSGERVAKAKAEIQAEAAKARESMAAETDRLANEIADKLLNSGARL